MVFFLYDSLTASHIFERKKNSIQRNIDWHRMNFNYLHFTHDTVHFRTFYPYYFRCVLTKQLFLIDFYSYRFDIFQFMFIEWIESMYNF